MWQEVVLSNIWSLPLWILSFSSDKKLKLTQDVAKLKQQKLKRDNLKDNGQLSCFDETEEKFSVFNLQWTESSDQSSCEILTVLILCVDLQSGCGSETSCVEGPNCGAVVPPLHHQEESRLGDVLNVFVWVDADLVPEDPTWIRTLKYRENIEHEILPHD